MYIWIHDKYSSTSFKQRLWQRKIVLIWQNSEKLLIQIMRVTVVQWSGAPNEDIVQNHLT